MKKRKNCNPLPSIVSEEPKYVSVHFGKAPDHLFVLNETTFVFPDGRRTFSLFVNPSAVEEQRSLAIEDITGDGNVDLLVTSHANLFGGVFMGDGKGNFALLDTFVSGYEPVVAVPYRTSAG